MGLTWISLAANLTMGLGAKSFVIYAVKRDYLCNIQASECHVFWSGLEELANRLQESGQNGNAQSHP